MKKTTQLVLTAFVLSLLLPFTNCGKYRSAASDDSQKTVFSSDTNVSKVVDSINLGFPPPGPPPPLPRLELADTGGTTTAKFTYGTCSFNGTFNRATFLALVNGVLTAPKQVGGGVLADSGEPTVTFTFTNGAVQAFPLYTTPGSVEDNGQTLNAIYSIINQLQVSCTNTLTTIHYHSHNSPPAPSNDFSVDIALNGGTAIMTAYMVDSNQNCQRAFDNIPLPANLVSALGTISLSARTTLCNDAPDSPSMSVSFTFADGRSMYLKNSCSDPVVINNGAAVINSVGSLLNLLGQSTACIPF